MGQPEPTKQFMWTLNFGTKWTLTKPKEAKLRSSESTIALPASKKQFPKGNSAPDTPDRDFRRLNPCSFLLDSYVLFSIEIIDLLVPTQSIFDGLLN